MKKAVIYGRVSTSKQDFDRQVFELETFAQKNDYKIVEVFAEKISGLKKGKDRTEFERMREYVDQYNIPVILATEISRFGRTQLDTQINVGYFVEKKVNIYFKDANLYTLNKEGKYDGITELHISILANRAQEEARTLKQRIISGLRYSVSNGGSGTGIVMPYGYKKVNKKLVIDEEESKVIKLIFSKYLTGMGTQKVAKYLNEEKILTRFNKIYKGKKLKQKYGLEKEGKEYTWKDGTVYRILTNSLYIGERKYKGEKFKITPIIDKVTFDKVQERLSKNYNKKDINRKYDNPLKDIIVCGCCGLSYYQHKRFNGKDNAFKCISKRYSFSGKDQYCGNPSVNIDKLLRSLYVTCSPLIIVNKKMIGDHKQNVGDQIKGIDEKIKAVEKEIRSINNQVDKLLTLHLSDKLSVDHFTKHNNKLQASIKKENEKILSFNIEREKLEKVRQGYNSKFKALTQESFNQEISRAFKKITIHSTKAVKPLHNQDVPVKIVVDPILTTLAKTEYIITRGTNIIHYLKKGRVVEQLPL